MSPPWARAAMGFLDEVMQHRDSLVRGLTLVLGGAALILVGTLIGLGGTKVFQLVAGTIAVSGLVLAFLGFFLYLVPPLLPAK